METSGSSGSKNKASAIMIPRKDLADYFPMVAKIKNNINQKNNSETNNSDSQADLETGPTTQGHKDGLEHQNEVERRDGEAGIDIQTRHVWGK